MIGSITALYTILIEGDDENDPVGDTVRAILDGHLFLSRRLAGQAVYPPIDPTLSVSPLLIDLADQPSYRLALRARQPWRHYQRLPAPLSVRPHPHRPDPPVHPAPPAPPPLLHL